MTVKELIEKVSKLGPGSECFTITNEHWCKAVDALNKKDLIERIETIADYSERVELTNVDAVELIKSIKRQITIGWCQF